ncbi:MAG: tRNA (guanosine(37)-N1)-methyltransferase TrmD [Chloroflexi bacterium]|nr:tRNA (guanosine(37)-N1)-methyltransferase TrmD [Chloroflexota bacterium]
MRIDVLTIFPEMFPCWLGSSILKHTIEKGLVDIKVHNIRDYTHDRHHTVDDYPYGGGAGMIFKPEPVFKTVEAVKSTITDERVLPIIMLTPQGRLFTQQVAGELSAHRNMLLICGRYEGVDARVHEHLVTDEISIGDYVLSGGELAAMVVMESVIRLLPGVLGSEDSALEDSHVAGLLEYPQYTRPPEYRGWKVPEVLLSGNHAQIAAWRREQAIRRTLERRPELLEKAKLTTKERELVESLKNR